MISVPHRHPPLRAVTVTFAGPSVLSCAPHRTILAMYIPTAVAEQGARVPVLPSRTCTCSSAPAASPRLAPRAERRARSEAKPSARSVSHLPLRSISVLPRFALIRLPPVASFSGHAAAGLPAVSSGAARVRAVDRRFRHAVDVAGKFACSTTAFDLFTAEMAATRARIRDERRPDRHLHGGRVLQRWAVRRRDIAGRRSGARAEAAQAVASAVAHVVCYAIVLAGSLPSLVIVFTSFRKTSGPVFHPGFGLTAMPGFW